MLESLSSAVGQMFAHLIDAQLSKVDYLFNQIIRDLEFFNLCVQFNYIKDTMHRYYRVDFLRKT